MKTNQCAVKHSHPNPRHNEELKFSTKKEAIEEMKKYVSEGEQTGTSTLYKNGDAIAWRDWNKSRISWI